MALNMNPQQSAFLAKRDKTVHKPFGDGKPAPQVEPEDHEEGDHEEVKNVVAEHGEAHKHEIEKKDGEYHSTTHHADGHKHVAKHSSLDEAHQHGKHAMGEGDEKEAGSDQHEDLEDSATSQLEEAGHGKNPSWHS